MHKIKRKIEFKLEKSKTRLNKIVVDIADATILFVNYLI